MLVIGAKGFAIEVLEILKQSHQLEHLAFYDDVDTNKPKFLFDEFPILHSLEEAEDYFKTVDARFSIGIGNPVLRKKMYETFTNIGGVLTSTISPFAQIGSFDVNLGEGCNILAHSIFSNSTNLGKGCIVYYNAMITHHCNIGDFVEISPGVTFLGRCTVGDYTHVGANATILADLKIGKHVVIGAGAVVTKNVPDHTTVVGVPAKPIGTKM